MAVDETINNLIKELKQERKGHHKVSVRWLLSSLEDRESMIGKFFTSLFKEYMEFPDYIFIDPLTAPPPSSRPPHNLRSCYHLIFNTQGRKLENNNATSRYSWFVPRSTILEK